MLQTSQLIGFGAGGPGGASEVTVENTDNSASGTNGAVFSFSSQAIGTAGSNRTVVIITGTGAGLTVTGATNVTIGGISATKVIERINASTDVALSMWKADVPTGTTATVVVTWNASMYRCSLGVWAVYDANTAETDTLSATTTAITVGGDINVPANGILIAGNYVAGNNGTNSWNNPSEDFDTQPVETDQTFSGASDDALSDGAYASAQSSLSCIATSSGGIEQHVMVAAAWGL